MVWQWERTDVASVPDEHLLKISGIAEKSLAQLRSGMAEPIS